MRAVKFLVNWVAILTSSLWLPTVNLILWVTKEEKVPDWATGKIWFWK